MLRLCLTLSVLLGLQVAGTGADHRVGEACKSMICIPLTKIVVHDSYEEQFIPELQWVHTFINGTDLKTATDVTRFFDYSQFNNAADTIVPISAPWMVSDPFDNGDINRGYSFLISLPLEVQSPPEPRDPSVHVIHGVVKIFYVRTYQEKTEDYERLANEFKKNLENDQHFFYSNRVYLAWYNKRGLFQIGFQKNKTEFISQMFHYIFRFKISEMC